MYHDEIDKAEARRARALEHAVNIVTAQTSSGYSQIADPLDLAAKFDSYLNGTTSDSRQG